MTNMTLLNKCFNNSIILNYEKIIVCVTFRKIRRGKNTT
jgi:hypothetical protein